MKFRRQRRVWKPTTSFASSPSWIARRISSGSTVPVVGSRPRDVDEVRERASGPRVANEARREVEVVVVEEDGRARIAVELVEHGVGERAVDRRRSPRSTRGAGRGRSLGSDGETPQVVLQEPQHRVRDDVVVPVVRVRVVRDEAQPDSSTRRAPSPRTPRRRSRPRQRDPRRSSRSRSTSRRGGARGCAAP